jgi:hypothetical protein
MPRKQNSSKLTKAAHLAIRKQKRNAVIKRQVPASLATVHEWPCLQKELAVEDTEQVLNKVDNGDSETDDEQYTPGCDGKVTIEECKELGMAFVTQEEVGVTIKVAYVIEYREPNESEWGSIATGLNVRWGVSITTIKDMFRQICDGDKKPRSNGRPRKLTANNVGLH